jgi:hypothetical protein
MYSLFGRIQVMSSPLGSRADSGSGGWGLRGVGRGRAYNSSQREGVDNDDRDGEIGRQKSSRGQRQL